MKNERDAAAEVMERLTVCPLGMADLPMRAIRCNEKTSFRAVGEVQTPDGVALLMVCERSKGEP